MNREDVAMDVTVQNVEILRKEVQAAKLLLSECAEIFSEEGICNIELRGYLSGKLSAGEVIELLDPPAEQRNQCDGCQAGIPLVDGAHRMGRPGSYPDLMSCQKERYEHPEQAEGAQGERETARKALSPENQRVVPVQPLLAEPHPLAALAQPSPAEDMSAAQELAGVKAILNDMADALKRLTFHARTTGGTAGPDAALMNACERAERILSLGGMGAAFMRGCDEHESQPSPAAPELEAPTSVGVLILGGAVSSTELGDNDVTLDGQVVERIQRELVSDSEDVAVELMIVGQHYRILQALRADRDNARRTAEYWKAEHLAANAALDAAQARVAELTAELRNLLHNLYGYEGFGSEVKGAMGSAKDALSRADNAPVAQAGQVPEGYMVLQTASLSHVLGLVEGAMEEAYGNAFQVCCGKGSGGECCGDPEAGWSPEDQRTMDVLNPIQRELRAMLDATPAQGGDA